MRRISLFSAILCVGVGLLSYSLYDGPEVINTYKPRESDHQGYLANPAMEYLRSIRRNVHTGVYDPADHRVALASVNALAANNATKSVNFIWKEEGPDNIGGRVRTILIDQDDPTLIYAGGVAGGLWKTEYSGDHWVPITTYDGNYSISAIAQTDNGNLYIGTGNTFEGGGGNGSSGFAGDGLWYSTDAMASFTLLDGSDSWSNVNEIETQGNIVWAATSSGLIIIDGTTNMVTGNGTDFGMQAGTIEEVEIGPEGEVIVAVAGNGKTWLSIDGGQSFNSITDNTDPTLLPSVGGRGEVAISPDDQNYIYIAMASGGGILQGIYRSTDKGTTWTVIAPSGSSFDPYNYSGNPQGKYDNTIGVKPGHPDQVWVGGIVMFAYINNQWEQQNFNGSGLGNFLTVHSDIHEFQWAPDGTLYIGCDGGIYRSVSFQGFNGYYASNRGFNVTQFYEIDFSNDGNIVGGTQDNGTQYIYHQSPTSWLESYFARGGDGFGCAISHEDPDIMFATIYQGDIRRAKAELPTSQDFSLFYDNYLMSEYGVGPLDDGIGGFYTEIELFENPFDLNSLASIMVVMPDSIYDRDTLIYDVPVPGDSQLVAIYDTEVIYYPGDTLWYETANHNVPMKDLVTDTIFPNDTLFYQDPNQAIFAAGFNSSDGIFITRQAMQFDVTPEWYMVANNDGDETNPDALSGGSTTTMTFDEPNGAHLYVGMSNGTMFRISNLDSAYSTEWADVREATHVTTCTKILTVGGGSVLGIAVDKKNADHVVVCIGGYGTLTHVYETTNATTATSHASAAWSSIHGSGATALPNNMPIYDVEISRDYVTDNIILVGTEFGVFATDDGGITWSEENNGMARVPTFVVKQQWREWEDGAYNTGKIYVGTHGRGAFSSSTLLDVPEEEDELADGDRRAGLTIYPNPVLDKATVEFTLKQRERVTLYVFDLQGKMVKSEEVELGAGTQKMTFDTFALDKGTYFVNITSESLNESAQIVVLH